MKRLDRIFTNDPVYGSRRLQVALLREGISVGRRRVRRLMRKLGLWAVRPKRNTSKRHPGHQVYPYLLRGKTIDRANQVWAADITYIPMRQGFLYLVAIIDWATRRVLSWRLSNTLTAEFCVEALSEALARFGKPGIFNTDQGAQFTSDAFTQMLRDHGIAISMDGRGRCLGPFPEPEFRPDVSGGDDPPRDETECDAPEKAELRQHERFPSQNSSH